MSMANFDPSSFMSGGGIQPLLDWQAACMDSLLQVQRMQFEILAAWFQPFAGINQDLWDQWIARFGVPIDG